MSLFLQEQNVNLLFVFQMTIGGILFAVLKALLEILVSMFRKVFYSSLTLKLAKEDWLTVPGVAFQSLCALQ